MRYTCFGSSLGVSERLRLGGLSTRRRFRLSCLDGPGQPLYWCLGLGGVRLRLRLRLCCEYLRYSCSRLSLCLSLSLSLSLLKRSELLRDGCATGVRDLADPRSRSRCLLRLLDAVAAVLRGLAGEDSRDASRRAGLMASGPGWRRLMRAAGAGCWLSLDSLPAAASL